MINRLIKTKKDYETALSRIDDLMGAKSGTPEADELDLLVVLVEFYEENQHSINVPDPVDAIRFRMDQMGLRQKDLVPFFGNKSRVSEVLNRKRPLTLPMIRALHKGLGIPVDILVNKPEQIHKREAVASVAR